LKQVEDLDERDTKGQTAIKQKMQREQNCQVYKIICNTLKPKWSKGIRYLDVPLDKKLENWRRVTNEEDIKTILLDRYKKHFNQANNTPFAKVIY
jgi:hypothetical protein